VFERRALADVAAAADVPLWLRRLPTEAFTRRIARLPESKAFGRQIANHLPSRRSGPFWLRAVADMNDVANETAAI
jgi:hypothetical protein